MLCVVSSFQWLPASAICLCCLPSFPITAREALTNRLYREVSGKVGAEGSRVITLTLLTRQGGSVEHIRATRTISTENCESETQDGGSHSQNNHSETSFWNL